MARIDRTQFVTFLNVGTQSMPDYALVGQGITSAPVNYQPQTEEEQYIHQKSGTTSIVGYRPTMPIEMKMDTDDEVCMFVDGLRRERATLSDAETDIIMVYLYETPVGGEYPAEKQTVQVQIDEFSGEPGANPLNFTFLFQGDAVQGMFDPTDATFTSESEGSS
ncbi:MAG TPA: hypothetical protein PLL88_06680 [Anaerolineaceae bacterium]|nr:hypothetical protein [Anaerolineaceae bacterium]